MSHASGIMLIQTWTYKVSCGDQYPYFTKRHQSLWWIEVFHFFVKYHRTATISHQAMKKSREKYTQCFQHMHRKTVHHIYTNQTLTGDLVRLRDQCYQGVCLICKVHVLVWFVSVVSTWVPEIPSRLLHCSEMANVHFSCGFKAEADWCILRMIPFRKASSGYFFILPT